MVLGPSKSGWRATRRLFENNSPTVLMQQSNPNAPNFVPQNYGGYILPGSTLDNLRVFASQWNTDLNIPYNMQEIIANVTPQK